MKEPRYPRITPLRAVGLLEDCERALGKDDLGNLRWAVNRMRDAMANHVRAELTRRKRRARRRASS